MSTSTRIVLNFRADTADFKMSVYLDFSDEKSPLIVDKEDYDKFMAKINEVVSDAVMLHNREPSGNSGSILDLLG